MKQLWLCVALVAAGCAGPNKAHTAPPPVDKASLVDMATVSWNFVWRQAITAEYTRPNTGNKRETASFEAVLQKQAETLTMVGLTPFGSRAFVAHQKGLVVKVDEGQTEQLPFPPEFIFLDVNRCFFAGLSSTPAADGWHKQELGGETIADEWSSGRLVQRVLRNSSSPAPITIRYGGGFIQGAAPNDVELINERFNYRLQIKTLESENL